MFPEAIDLVASTVMGENIRHDRDRPYRRAPGDERARSMGVRARQTLVRAAIFWEDLALARRLEDRLDAERDQLALWIPVGIGTGVGLWFLLGDAARWLALMLGCGGVTTIAFLLERGRRAVRVAAVFALLVAVGCALIWLRSWQVAEPVLDRPTVTRFYAQIDSVERLAARDKGRLTLLTGERQDLPPKVRVNIPLDTMTPEYRAGAVILLRARLMPPGEAALPGAYDFARRAWFMGLGATGTALGPIEIVTPAPASPVELEWLRAQLAEHVASSMDGAAGAIGATLATGDRGAIDEADAQAMRDSGLAHLLSISGLHVTAVVGAVYLIVLKSLALFPWLALRVRLPVVAAATAAVAALSYTLLTGAQVPTVRACVAALLVLAALVLGRSAITLRMVAAGALFVLVVWPETLVGPSFQLSFAAVTAIIALHNHPKVQAFVARRDEQWWRKALRVIGSLFLTGIVVELALMPIAIFHFHKAGLYGALANIVAIPLTTFVIMPAEAMALMLDIVGLGAPLWLVAELALEALVGLAHLVSSQPGSVVMLPTVPVGAFLAVVAGGLWICLWTTRWRYVGALPIGWGVIAMALQPAPDLYITGDGRHLAIRDDAGRLAMLRTRSGEFIRDIVRENAGVRGEPVPMDDWPGARCNADSCVIPLRAGGRDWTVLATRSGHFIPALSLAAACRRVDIVVSDRWLPRSCEPAWMKIDRRTLSRTGGVTISFASAPPTIETVAGHSRNHMWSRLEPAEN